MRPGATRATVIIPALDEAAVIGGLVRRVPAGLVDEVIVVDNGSRDATAAAARQAGARVVSEPRRGYGSACWAGVTALRSDTEVAVFIDGDGSQHPEEMPRVLRPIAEGWADLVLGTRSRGRNQPLHASLGTRLVAALVAHRYGCRVTDIGPYRAVRVDLLRRLDLRERTHGWPVEMVVKAAAMGARIAEVPVSQAARLGGRSKVSGTFLGSVRAGWAFLRVALRAGREVERRAPAPRP